MKKWTWEWEHTLEITTKNSNEKKVKEKRRTMRAVGRQPYSGPYILAEVCQYLNSNIWEGKAKVFLHCAWASNSISDEELSTLKNEANAIAERWNCEMD